MDRINRIRRSQRVLLTTTLVLALCSAVHAETIGSPVFATEDAAARACTVTNIGATAVTVNSAQLLHTETGLDVVSTSNCGGTLQPGGTCFFGNDGAVSGMWQRAVVELEGRNVAKQIRAQCEVIDVTGRVITLVEIR